MVKRFNVIETSIVLIVTVVRPLSKEDDPNTSEERKYICRIPYKEGVGGPDERGHHEHIRCFVRGAKHNEVLR